MKQFALVRVGHVPCSEAAKVRNVSKVGTPALMSHAVYSTGNAHSDKWPQTFRRLSSQVVNDKGRSRQQPQLLSSVGEIESRQASTRFGVRLLYCGSSQVVSSLSCRNLREFKPDGRNAVLQALTLSGLAA